MKIVLISDIHIYGADDPLYRSLLSMVEREVGKEDTLVLAGDIFDFFVGKQPVLLKRYQEFFQLLRTKLALGANVEYIEGNHDFHLSAAFTKELKGEPGFHVHSSEVSLVSTGGRRLYVAHGDLIDREDKGYLALRLFFRSPLIRFAAMALPEKAVEFIGERSSEASRKRNPRLPSEKGVAAIDRLRAKYRAFAMEKFREGYAAIVLGHCHDLDGADFSEGGRQGRYLNIGYPRAHRSFVVFSDERGLERRDLA